MTERWNWVGKGALRALNTRSAVARDQLRPSTANARWRTATGQHGSATTRSGDGGGCGGSAGGGGGAGVIEEEEGARPWFGDAAPPGLWGLFGDVGGANAAIPPTTGLALVVVGCGAGCFFGGCFGEGGGAAAASEGGGGASAAGDAAAAAAAAADAGGSATMATHAGGRSKPDSTSATSDATRSTTWRAPVNRSSTLFKL